MSAGTRFDAASLREEDFVRFNHWLWITRLRSIAGILTLTGVVNVAAPGALRMGPILLVCLADLIPSVLYHRWLRTRRHLRELAYTQLLADTFAIIVGLFFVHESAVLFHFILLMVVVPA